MDTTSLYWLQQTVVALPLALWIYIGLGVPWALVALPRSDWQDRPLVICLAFAFGPALLTAWMFIPGVVGGTSETALMRFDLIFAGTLLIAFLGMLLAWRKAKTTTATKTARHPLAFDEKLLIGLIAAALALRLIVIAFWPFTAYDPMWVYGYQGRLYTLLGYIPQDIGYYPQFMQLQYAFMQLFVGGYDDHAARAILPFLQIGAVLAAYVLGSRLFNRRTGIILAALWALYHHVGLWSHVGDLEIPQAFLFTLTAAFFLIAWLQQDRAARQRYALLAGLVFGIAMWTKPTAGAFVWGVVVLVVIELLRVRGDWRRWLPRFEVAAITGLACIPLGALWYLRNIALGLPPLVFPHESWLSQATRSGDLFGWPLIAGIIALAYLASQRQRLPRNWALLCGVVLLIVGLAPSMPLFNDARHTPPQSYITLTEAIVSIAGLGLLLLGSLPHWTADNRSARTKITWASLLALPYFMTWFYSYSYHARLSFAVVPLLALPTAALLAHWIKPQNFQPVQRLLYGMTILVCGIPFVIVSYFSAANDVDWLWSGRLPDDSAKYQAHAAGVFQVASHLHGYEEFYGEEARVIAPGEQRLWFFLPHIEIITDTIPTRLDELGDATHFVYGDLARWRYEDDNGIDPLENQVVASLAREEVFSQTVDYGDGRFRYELYDVHLDGRFPVDDDLPVSHIPEDTIFFGDVARYIGDDAVNNQFGADNIRLRFAFEVVATPQANYWLRLSLLNEEDGQIYHQWQTPFAQGRHAYYNSQLWQAGEIVTVEIRPTWPEDNPAPAGQDYRLLVDLVDIESGEAVPIYINGEALDSGLPMVLGFGVTG